MEHERIIRILDYLRRVTDDSHSVTVRDIQAHLANTTNLRDVSALTIRRDLERLESQGVDIKKTNGPHNTALYSVTGKKFTVGEIRFIVDSLSINKFLSARQKQELIHKFEGMCSESEIRQLISRIELNEAGRAPRDLLGNLDKLHRLISERRRVHFSYGKFDSAGNIRYDSKPRDVLPVKVIYVDERFYLRCWSEETGAFRTYRIDRMKNIKAGDPDRRRLPRPEKPEGFVVNVFEPERFERVTFRVKRYLLDEMLEQLGHTASSRDDFDDPGKVIIRAVCGINTQFYLWVMRYGDGVEITSPSDVRRAFSDELKKVSALYADV